MTVGLTVDTAMGAPALAPVRSVEPPVASVAESRHRAAWRSRSSRAVVATMAVVAMIGSAGTAYAIRETLFPSIGVSDVAVGVAEPGAARRAGRD